MSESDLWRRERYLEPERELPIVRRIDVLVAGGGPAGVGAALAAARTGASVALTERYGFLGGQWTTALVNPILDYRDKGGIVAEIMTRLSEMGAITPTARFDPEALKYLLDGMALDAGVELCLHRLVVGAIVEGEQVRGLVTESKSGREAMLAKVVIDCTGDGDVCAMAGVPFTKGREADELMQAMTTFFMLSSVSFRQEGRYQVFDLLREAAERVAPDYHVPYRQPSVFTLPSEGLALVQLAHMHGFDGTNADDLTRAEIEGRRQVRDAVALMSEHIPEFSGVKLAATAPQVGVRETRHIQGRYRLTEDDAVQGRQFPDGICTVRFSIDVHGPLPTGEFRTIEIAGARVKPYQIPYRSLLPSNRQGLLMAGQCISATSRAHSSLRVTGDCLAMGQAAGTAAALAVRRGADPSDVAPPELIDQLRRDGAQM